jgi:hypothetical protein
VVNFDTGFLFSGDFFCLQYQVIRKKMARWIITLAKINREGGKEMCKALSLDLYCKNFNCPHNLFWEELSLDRHKIQITDKALEIRNCCCKIIYPWTPEEISDAWGIARETIRRSEEEAYRKLQKKIRIDRKRPLYRSTVHRRVIESRIN